ncbi:hypothetical protein C488_06785 [Natrinema pellirubrum DSM 15624]|uniref:Resolvase n=1 Tax=Natrinema pellirubrum (strain DSM 15624 / CIP 106293 / JCM 10476 / NCIMB 786 / 157) TaxID=797303 RepID=L0JKR7_NATP1|nr:hypothetical protein [Natrinema pellirubrum]AGB31849.1 hypothetical protein Natpe_2017 [Natrinema pellirubrum DSM 15624]ELY77805.1 hypothetical protein C488_06785 [Natrinema pellirubrum DSM 15624]
MIDTTIEDYNSVGRSSETEAEIDGEEFPSKTEEETGVESDNEDTPQFLAVATAKARTSLSDPIRAVLKYAAEQEGAESDYKDRTELVTDVTTGTSQSAPVAAHGGIITWSVRPDRSAVDAGLELLDDTESLSVVVIDKIESLGATAADMEERAARILDSHGCDLVLLESGLHLEAESEAAQAHIRTLAAVDRAGIEIQREATVSDLRARGADLPSGGRAPLGFEWRDGELVTSDQYSRVCSTLELIEAESGDVGISKGEAARRLDTSHRTINRCLDDRPDLYGLDN